MRDLRAAIEALANDWEANFAINQVHLTCIEQLRAILAECEEPLPTIHDLRGIVPYARLREALSRLVDVAEVYSADQAGATHPLCGLVQPISVVEGRELNDALAQANAALSASGPEKPAIEDRSREIEFTDDEPAGTAKPIEDLSVLDQDDFNRDPSGGGSNLPAPKRYRCRACEQEFDSKVGMHREHITDIDGSWCSGIVEEMP